MMELISPFLTLASALIIIGFVALMVNTYIPVDRRIRMLTNVVLSLIVVGMVLWLINTYVPMAESIKTILNVVVVLGTCVGVLQAVGLWGPVVEMWNHLRKSQVHRDEVQEHEGPNGHPAA